MLSECLRLYLEGISPYRVVYTVIVSSLVALLLPLFSGSLHLIKKIHYDEGRELLTDSLLKDLDVYWVCI
jgi:hypothetical protein